MGELTVVIPGEPFGKQRPRMNTKTGRAYTPRETKDAERAVALSVMAEGVGLGMPWDRPIRFHAHFRTANVRPTGRSHTIDIDNALKLVMDALNGIAWWDDVQVVELVSTIERDELIQPQTILTIQAATEEIAA